MLQKLQKSASFRILTCNSANKPSFHNPTKMSRGLRFFAIFMLFLKHTCLYEAVLELFAAESCFEASCMFHNGPNDHIDQPILEKSFNIMFMPVWQVSSVSINYNICKLNTWNMKLFWSCLLQFYCTYGVINACLDKCEHLRHRTLARNISSHATTYSKYFTSPVHSKP